MGKYIGDCVISTCEYVDKNGNTRKNWVRIGGVYRTDKCDYVCLDVLPIPNDGKIRFAIFPKKEVKDNTTQYKPNNMPHVNTKPELPKVNKPNEEDDPFKASFYPQQDSLYSDLNPDVLDLEMEHDKMGEYI